MLKVLAIVAVLSAAVVPAAAQVPTPEGSWAAQQSCSHTHRSKVAYRLTTNILKNHSPLTAREKLRVGHLRACQTTRAKSRAVGRHVKRLRAWRMSYAHRYPIQFNRLPASWQNWAWATSDCESGGTNDPGLNTGNGFLGPFQFMQSTWSSSPGATGTPTQHSWHFQAMVAVHLAWRDGTGHWPNCP